LYNNPFKRQIILAIGYLLTSLGIPCIYYGTEQGFDGGGDHDKYIRECMFGGKWGAFNTTGHHFFNPENPIYKDISRIAEIRRIEPALRYGRQYFREVSEKGVDFGYPADGRCTLAYSRILDDTEILVTINLDSKQRNDYVTVDACLMPENKRLKDTLNDGLIVPVERISGRHAVKVPLEPHQIRILKLIA